MVSLENNPYHKIKMRFPGGVNSPVRSCKGLLENPFIVAEGKGDLIFDLQGKKFIDYCCSWGALIHGHAHPKINEAVKNRIDKGTSFGITTLIEEKLGSLIAETMPVIDMLRFVASGTEATMSALRLARGATKRDKIIKFIGCYHGHSDSLLVKAGSGVADLPEASSAGVPYDYVKHTICVPYNDIEACKKAMSDEIAAVIVEPVAGNMGVIPGTKEFIHALREETTKYGSVLIFDEVISGYRVGLTGASGYYGVTPDLTCLGKVIGGGFNVAAFGGKKDLMELMAPLGPVYQAGTLSGNPVAMEAGHQALQMVREEGFYDRLAEKADIIISAFQQIEVSRMGSMFFPKVDESEFKRFFQFLFERGIYIPPSPHETWFVSSAHTEENLYYTQRVIMEYFN